MSWRVIVLASVFVFNGNLYAIDGELSLDENWVFDAKKFRDETPCGLDLKKIYRTISILRKERGVGEGALTSIMMYMAVKDKLVDAVNRVVDAYETPKKKARKLHLADEFHTVQHELEVLQLQVKESGDEVIFYFGISAVQLAQIPGFSSFKSQIEAE